MADMDRAIVARKVRAAFGENRLHTASWGRVFYIGPEDKNANGNEAATKLVMNLLDLAGVFDDGD